MSTNNPKLQSFNENIGNIEVLVRLLAQAKTNEFISTPEAKEIFKDILKEAGLKKVEIKKEVKEVK